MNYNWRELDTNYNGQNAKKYMLRIDYNDGTPCYDHLEATIEPAPKHVGYTASYLASQGLDPREQTWKGEVGGTNFMAESLASGWDSFFRFTDDDIDRVFDEVTAYLDDLMRSGKVPQEWISANTW